MKIVITGATGNLGKLVVRQLIDRKLGGQLIVSVRKPEAAEHWKKEGVEVRYGDYDVPASLVSSFEGAGKLLLISSPHRDDVVRLRQHQAALEAAREAGVRHIAYTSMAYADKGKLPLHRLHLDTEEAIRRSGIPYTMLRNSLYMDLLRFLGLREAMAGGLLLSPPGEWSFNIAAREDLAAAAAAVLREEGHENRSYELTAPRTWNLADLARVLSELSGRKVVRQTDAALNSPLYSSLTLSDLKSVSPDLERLAGYPLSSLQDEVRKLLDAPSIEPRSPRA
ncbi:NmrA family NAD(P)-binding protein [Paenibacillus filicis]|uniref:NmrA family NAD(P)-binding protein n=1 Tax=Paenibacillus filicis TaxID=669464 RepID=A0ABU9DTB0_9BACL